MRDSMPSAATSYVITDELACLVDGALARLCKREQHMCDRIWLYYGAKHPGVRIGKQRGVSEGKVRELIKTGGGSLDRLCSRVDERSCVKRSCPYGIALFSWHSVKLFSATPQKMPGDCRAFVNGERLKARQLLAKQ